MKNLRFALIFMSLLMSLMVFTACGEKSDDTTDTTGETTAISPETTKEVTTEVTTTAETTTKKKIEYEYTSVAKWDFTTMKDGDTIPFSHSPDVESLKLDGGKLVITSKGGDPFITYTGDNIGFDAGNIQEIVVKIYNGSDSDKFQMFFTTPTVNWSEDASFKDSYEVTGDITALNEFHLDTMLSSSWADNITGIRIDPISSEGQISIESIEFLTATVKE